VAREGRLLPGLVDNGHKSYQLPAIKVAARSLGLEAVKLTYRNALQIVRDIACIRSEAEWRPDHSASSSDRRRSQHDY
jgi:hypothetical protein